MVVKLTREKTFDAAHMLSNYEGQCANLHGHTYKAQVTIEGYTDEKTGMLIDFNELNRVIGNTISTLDHATIISDVEHRDRREQGLLEFVASNQMKHKVLQNKCTAENIADFIKAEIAFALSDRGVRVSVKLWETPNSFVEV